MPETMDLLPALAEIRRRTALLVEAGNNLQPIEAHIASCDLDDPQQLQVAEAIARLGRAAKVTLVVAIPDIEGPLLPWLGSAVLVDFAEEGRSVRVEAQR